MHYSRLVDRHEAAWISLLGLLKCIAYLCIGLVLSALLRRHARVIESVLIAGLGYSFLFAYARVFLFQEQEPPFEVILRLISSAFLTVYVFNHVERLSVQLVGRGGARPPIG